MARNRHPTKRYRKKHIRRLKKRKKILKTAEAEAAALRPGADMLLVDFIEEFPLDHPLSEQLRECYDENDIEAIKDNEMAEVLWEGDDTELLRHASDDEIDRFSRLPNELVKHIDIE